MTATLGMVMAVTTWSATAQAPLPRPFTPPPPRATVSPYLNLFSRGNSAAINYYGVVRPEFEFRSDIGQLRRQLTTTQEEVRDNASAGLATGHRTVFFNYAPYFSGGSPSASTATGGPALQTPAQAGAAQAGRTLLPLPRHTRSLSPSPGVVL